MSTGMHTFGFSTLLHTATESRLFTVVDFILLIFMLFFTLKGLWKGALREFFSFLAIFCGMAAGAHFSLFAERFIEPYISVNAIRAASAYAAVYIIVWFAVSLMGWILGKHSGDEETKAGSRLIGGALALLKSFLLISMMIYSAESYFPDNPITGSSFITPSCVSTIESLSKFLPFISPDNSALDPKNYI